LQSERNDQKKRRTEFSLTIALSWTPAPTLVKILEVRLTISDRPPAAPDPAPISIATLDPMLDQREVTVKFSVSDLGGVAQLSVPGQAPTFVIEATSEHNSKDLTVWIEGELANVLDRLQLSLCGSN